MPRLTFITELPSDELWQLCAQPPTRSFLARGGHRLSMALLDLDAPRADLVRELEAAGVEIVGWMLLDVERGYWLNADNASHAVERYQALRAWATRERLQLPSIALDIEPPRTDLDALARRPLRTAWRQFRTRRRRDRVDEAEATYRELVETIRRDGRRVESFQLPPIVDERRAGSTLIRRTIGIVNVATDREILMLYRSHLGRELARAYYREAQAIAVGVTGGGVYAEEDELEPKLGWKELREDLLAAAQHCEELYVFSLEGCVRQQMLGELERLDWASPSAANVPFELAALGARGVVRWAIRQESWLDRWLPERR